MRRRNRLAPTPPFRLSQDMLTPVVMLILLFLFVAGIWAGAQNALAGGGSFVTLPALILAGLDPKLANIASTIAMFPGQLASGVAGRRMIEDVPGLRFRTLAIISLAGGAAGALLLLFTSSEAFDRLVPWLVLAATLIFAWGSFRRKPTGAAAGHVSPGATAVLQGAIATYGGYFSGGLGFLMMALLTMAGLAPRGAGAAKNMLAALINASAVLLFVVTTRVPLLETAALGLGAIAGGLWGVWLLRRIDEKLLRVAILILGIALFVGLLIRAYS